MFEGVNTTGVYSLLKKVSFEIWVFAWLTGRLGKFDRFVLMERVLVLNNWFLNPVRGRKMGERENKLIG